MSLDDIIPKEHLDYLVNLFLSTKIVNKTKNLESIILGIIYRYKIGCTWRSLKYCTFITVSWITIFKNFSTWSKKGIFKALFSEFVKNAPDVDVEEVFMDSTGVNVASSAHGAAGSNSKDEAIGKRTKGGFKTKIHLITDAHGNPLKIILTEGRRSDVTVAVELLASLGDIQVEKVSADKGYDSEAIRNYIKSVLKAEPVIPRRKNSKIKDENFDSSTYKGRHVIENRFNSLKRWRGINTRYDKTKRNFESGVYLSMLCDWIKLLVPSN